MAAESAVRPWHVHRALTNRCYAPMVLGQLAIEEARYATYLAQNRPDSPVLRFASDDAIEYAVSAWHAARKLSRADRAKAKSYAESFKF